MWNHSFFLKSLQCSIATLFLYSRKNGVLCSCPLSAELDHQHSQSEPQVIDGYKITEFVKVTI